MIQKQARYKNIFSSKGGDILNSRIKELREKLGMSQTEFAENLSLKRNSISLIEVGKRNPSNRTILDICNKFNVSEEWLRHGTGEIFLETPSNVIERLQQEFNLDEFCCNLIHEYLKLENEQRKVIQDFLCSIVSIKKRGTI